MCLAQSYASESPDGLWAMVYAAKQAITEVFWV